MPNAWILKGGLIYDGSGDRGYCGDVRLAGTKITHIAPHLPIRDETIIDADGLIVAPGLIDLHVHVYDGMNLHSISPAEAGLRTGVTSMLDTGSAGAMNYATFEKYIMRHCEETVYALLNISHFGVQGHPDLPPYLGDLFDAAYLDPAPAIRCIKQHSERLLGIKVRLTNSLAGGNKANERVALTNAVALSRQTGLMFCVHHVASSVPLDDVLSQFIAGDILTHIYHPLDGGGFQGETAAPTRAMLEARERGVVFDVGHGNGCFAWKIAEPACQQHGFWPDTISSDIHKFNVDGPVVDLPTTMSKFLYLGMSMEKIIQCVTANAAAAIHQQDYLGRILPGRAADITLLKLVPGAHRLTDSTGEQRIATQRIVPMCTFKNGRRTDCRSEPALCP
ncbi:MAG: amidohydrolase family protein [Phycisphaerales bacterium]|nr:amidohydrolase family protein [Phycisphaerales bacterium]